MSTLLLALALVACQPEQAPAPPAPVTPMPAPPPAAVKKVAFLYPVKVDALLEVEKGVREEMADQKVEFLVESAEGNPENFDDIARSAVRSGADVVVGIGTQTSQALLGLTDVGKVPPLVFTAVTNPADVLGAQVAAPRTLAATGLSDSPKDVNEKVVSLVKALRADADVVGVFVTQGESNSTSSFQALEPVAKAAGIQLIQVSTSSGVDKATKSLLAKNVDVILIPKDKNATSGVATIVETVLRDARDHKRHPVPVIAMDSGSVGGGAVAGVSASYLDIGRDTGKIVEQVLAGKSPSDIPVPEPTPSRIYVNLAAAGQFCLPDLSTTVKDAIPSGTYDATACPAP